MSNVSQCQNFQVKSGLPKTYRPSIDQIVRGLSQNAFLRDESPLRKSCLANHRNPSSMVGKRAAVDSSHRQRRKSSFEEDRLLRELESQNRPLSLAGSRTVEVVYVPPVAAKNKYKPYSYDDPPIIISDDGRGTNFIDLTRPPSTTFDQNRNRNSWVLPV